MTPVRLTELECPKCGSTHWVLDSDYRGFGSFIAYVVSSIQRSWRNLLLILVVLASLAAIMSHEPVGQDPAYHDFADRRSLFGVPNFFDVVSNLPFLIIGIAGVVFCLRNSLGALRYAWIAFFTGVALVSFGSAYYHWNPTSPTLVWDRLPMTVGFMGFFAALLGEHVHEKLGRFLLVPLVLLGFSSIVYWLRFDDLRFYFWIQVIPMLVIPILMVLFRSRHSHQWLLGVALVSYILAKVSEFYDPQIFGFTRSLFSGHSLKHLLAGLGCFAILAMLARRETLSMDRRPFGVRKPSLSLSQHQQSRESLAFKPPVTALKDKLGVVQQLNAESHVNRSFSCCSSH